MRVRKSKKVTKIIGWLPIIVFCFSVTFLSGQFAGGQGSEEDPWQIARAGDLSQIRDFLGAEHSDKYYVQTHDIELGEAPWNQDEGWIPIGPSVANSFRGKYDGNGYEIRGLTIDRVASNQSLFGCVDGALIENVRLVDVNINATGWGNIAALIGTSHNGTVVRNCSATGVVTGATAGNIGWQVGGLAGFFVNSTMTESYADVRVTGRTRCGGLVAWANASDVIDSYAVGTVNNSQGVAGGLVGLLMTHGDGQGNGSVRNSYATGAVTIGGNQGGGLVGTIGTASVSNCYATGTVTGTGGGLVGQSNTQNTVSDSYWDTETTGKAESAGGGTGLLTRQMIYPYDLNEAFVRWDFEEIWRQDTEFENEVNPGINNGYPYLYIQERDEPEPLDAPVVIIDVIEDEEGSLVRLRWEAVEGAASYKIYAADYANTDQNDWGDPIVVTDETQYRLGLDRAKFYYVIASGEDAP